MKNEHDSKIVTTKSLKKKLILKSSQLIPLPKKQANVYF